MMSKNILIAFGVIGLLIIVGVAAYILRPSPDASAPIEAIPVGVEGSANKEMEEGVTESKASDKQAEMPAVEGEAVKEMTAAEGVVVFSIVQAESEVRFSLGELLSGVPTEVVGVTDQVAGEIAIDPAAPSSATVGVIRVNARTLMTDNDFRNRAINNSILQTGTYEFVTFAPAEIINFPETPSVGQALEFQISGDLTVRDITHPIIFDITVTAVSEIRLEGSATAVLNRAEYDLKIPEVPRVADVDEEVRLEIDFVAAPK